MSRILFLMALIGLPATLAALPPTDEHFRVESVSEGFVDAMEIAVTPDGLIFVVERTGAMKLVDPDQGRTKRVATIPVEAILKVK